MKKVTLFFALLLSMVATGAWAEGNVIEKTLTTTATALEHAPGWETGLAGTVNNAWSLPIQSAVEKDLAYLPEGFYWGMGNGNTVCAATDLSSLSETAFNLVGRQAYTGSFAAQIYEVAELLGENEVICNVDVDFVAAGSRTNSSFSIWTIIDGKATMVAASESSAIAEGSVSFSAANIAVADSGKVALIWNANTAGQTISISDVAITLTKKVSAVRTGIFRIRNEYKGRGELVYNEEYANVVLNNITLGSYDVNNVEPTGNGTYWYIREYNEKVYIFNVEACKFLQNNNGKVTYSETASDQAALTADVQTEGEVNYVRFISPADATKFLSASCGWEPGENQVQFRDHEADADYFTLFADSGETMQKYAEQVEIANNLIEGLVEIVYNYTFAGEVAKSETFLLAAGSERPVASSLPFACEADYSAVPDYVDESGTFEIPVNTTEEFPFEFSADYATAKWNTWRMANRVGGTASYKGYVFNNGKKFQQVDLDEQPTAAKYLYAFVGTPFGFQIMTADERFVYTNCANNSDVYVAAEGRNLVAVASSYNPESAWTDYDKMFYFNAVGVGGGVNEMDQGDGYRKIGYWTGGGVNDNGSLVAIEAVEDINVYKIEFAEGTPTAGGLIFDEETYALGGPCNALSSDEAVTVDDVEAVEVEGYDTEVTIEGNVITVTYTPNRSEAWLELSALISEATEMTLPEGPWGTNPGYYNQEAVEAFPDSIQSAIDVLEAEEGDESYRAATANLRAAIKAIQPIMPEVGKIYMMVCGFPTFETSTGTRKTIYSTGTVMRWKSIDPTDLASYWYVSNANNDTIYFQNLQTAVYPKGYTTRNVAIPTQAAPNPCILKSVGEGQFNIFSKGSGEPFHAGNHGGGTSNEGNIMVWPAGVNTCSSWYVEEVNTFEVSMLGEYSTLILPFESPIPSGMEVYTCASITNATLNLEAVADNIEANTPYIIKGTPDENYLFEINNINTLGAPVTEGLLTGVFVTDTVPTGSYYLFPEEGYDCFMQVQEPSGEEEEDVPMVAGTNCYVTVPGSAIPVLYFDPALAIENLDANGQQPTANAIFNLAGQKMNKVQKGINIVDGKKVIY